MARMHSGKKGKSGSTWPSKELKRSWIRYKPKEVELLIAKLVKEGKQPSQVGTILRDVYGIPNVKQLTKKSINQILTEKKLLSEIPEDLMALIKKSVAVRKHIEENRQDKTAARGLQLTESKIKRLIKYYKLQLRLPDKWKYDPKKIRLYLN